MLMITAVAPSALARGPSNATAPVITAQEVRTVWTSEFGLTDPTGLTYVSRSGEFLVTGASSTGNAILLGDDEDLRAQLQLDALANPSTLSYDPVSDQVTVFDGQSRLEWSGTGLTNGAKGRSSSLASDAKSATYDAVTGDLLLLSSSGGEILRVKGNKTSKISLGSVTQAELIATSPADGLIYVMSADKTVSAIDSSGSLVQAYDLSGVELVDPTAMTFAPSSDATDGPTEQNLFVADTGGAQSLGGVVEVSLAAPVAAASVPVDTGTLVRSTATSQWSPGAPDPAGVTYLSDTDSLIVVDSEVDEVTGAGWHNVNMWRTYRNGSVIQTGTFWGSSAASFNGKVGFSKEPTGAGYDPGNKILFVSDDSAKKVFVIKKGSDGKYGTSDDQVSAVDAAAQGSTDTEDPEFDTSTGHLFFLDGVGREIYEVNPVDGVFGNGNDVITHFDISHLGPTDFEGLTINPARGSLLVGARSTKRIFEITKNGTLLREISVSGISGLRYISGLAFAPSSDNANLMSFYIADRQVDNGANSNENDGVLWEVRAPDSLGGGGPQNQAPTVSAGPDLTVVLPSAGALAGSANDDGLPNGTLTVQWSVVSAPSGGVVSFANANSASTTATFTRVGGYVLRLTASDGQLSASDDVSVQVSDTPVGGSDFTAVSQNSIYGTVVGGLSNTFAADGATQDITEITNAQGYRAKLEHTWTFNVTGTSRLTFVLKATHVGSESLKFTYSTNGGSTWKNMVTVSGSTTDYQFLLPSGVTGTVIVRVKDTDRTKGDTFKDTIRIDRLVLVPAS